MSGCLHIDPPTYDCRWCGVPGKRGPRENALKLAGLTHTKWVGWHGTEPANKNLAPVQPPADRGMGSFHPAFLRDER